LTGLPAKLSLCFSKWNLANTLSLAMTNKVLVTGANGFVGRETCRALADLNISVRRAVRSLPPEGSSPGELHGADSPAQEICRVGDIGESTDWSKALDGISVVVHLAAHVHVMKKSCAGALTEFHRVNTAGTEQLARAAVRAGVRRFVYLSSVGVNGRSTNGRPFTETDVPHPHDAYTVSKWVAEQKLQTIANDSTLKIVIIRPPIVYGPGEPGNFMRLVRLVDSGLPLPFGAIQGRHSLIYVRNLVNAIITCAKHPGAAGQTFLVSDGEDVSTLELIYRIANALGRRATLIPFSLSCLRVLGRLTGKSKQLNSLLVSLVIDSSRIRRELEWNPPCLMSDGLQETADWYLAGKKPGAPPKARAAAS
jgi:nucleoside-diphosphate-sugar epimerase